MDMLLTVVARGERHDTRTQIVLCGIKTCDDHDVAQSFEFDALPHERFLEIVKIIFRLIFNNITTIVEIRNF